MTIPYEDLMIVCSKCKEPKPYDDFYVRTNGKPQRECKGCSKARMAKRHQTKRDVINARERVLMPLRRQKVRDRVFAAYGGYKCSCCGETEPLFLTIDHINNDGAEFRRMISGKQAKGGGYHTYIWIVRHNFPSGFQVLCMNCNHGKRMNNGVCPHKITCNDHSQEVESSDSKRTAPGSQPGEEMVSSGTETSSSPHGRV